MSNSTAKQDDSTLSVVAAYDDLVRHSSVLTTGCEDEFMKFVVNSGVSRQRWEHAELECHRLRSELTKSCHDISSLEDKLNNARVMFNTELYLRKKAEAEKERLASQLQVLRQMVIETNEDEVTFNKDLIRRLDRCGVRSNTAILRQLVMKTNHGLDEIRSLDRCGVRSNTNIISPGLTRQAMNCRRSAINLTEASVLDVNDLSFDVDDTQGLCKSKTRTGTTFNKIEEGRDVKRNRSGLPVVLENVSKKVMRSDSVGMNDNIELVETEHRGKVRRSNMSEGRGRRSNITGNLNNNSSVTVREKEYKHQGEDEVVEGHSLVERTVTKPEKCLACSKRIQFGTICLKCLHCKISIHLECKEKAGTCVITSSIKVSSVPLPSIYSTPSNKNSIYLTPSKKKESKNTFFSSPMLR